MPYRVPTALWCGHHAERVAAILEATPPFAQAWPRAKIEERLAGSGIVYSDADLTLILGHAVSAGLLDELP